MPVPAGHWLILMAFSQLELINRSEVITGLQMREVNAIKDASQVDCRENVFPTLPSVSSSRPSLRRCQDVYFLS